MKFKRVFDARVWKTGNGVVITVPSSIVKKFKVKENEILEVALKR